MTIVVNDANILIDLVKLEILKSFFSLEFHFYTTDLVLNELYEYQKQALKAYVDQGQLQIEIITAEQFAEIIAIRIERPGLSEQDCSAFYQAKYLKATLITSDNTLRKFAETKAIDVHGHLWIFDQMVAANVLDPIIACEKLDELCETINPKLNLPKMECELRKKKWRGN